MLLETAIVMMNMKRKKDEKFVEIEEEDTTSNETNNWTLFDIMYLIFVVMWGMIFIALWLRIVYLAFSCSLGEGITSLLFSSHYSLYKFGDLIKVSCNTY